MIEIGEITTWLVCTQGTKIRIYFMFHKATCSVSGFNCAESWKEIVGHQIQYEITNNEIIGWEENMLAICSSTSKATLIEPHMSRNEANIKMPL